MAKIKHKRRNRTTNGERKPLARERSPFARSRVTQGLDLLPGVDGRSWPSRVFKDTYHTLLLHCGGDDVPETLRLMCRRAAALESELVNLEVKFAQLRMEGQEPEGSDLDLHSRLTNTLRRVCETLGWQRHMRDVTPSLGEYLADMHKREAEEVTT